MKRNYATAFPTFSTVGSLFQLGYNAYKRYKSSSYTLLPNETKMPLSKRRRTGARSSRSFVRRRRRSRYGGLRRKFSRFRRTLRRKGILAIETKYYEGSLSIAVPTYLDATPDQSPQRNGHLTAISRGSAASQRIGNKVWIRKLRIHFFLTANKAPEANNEQYVRIFVIRDQSPLAEDVSSATSTRIGYYLQATNNSGDLNLHPWQYINNFRADRPKILYSKLIKVSKDTGVAYETISWKKTINVFKPCHWSNDTSNTAVGKGQIYLFAYTNEDNPLYVPGLQFAWRTMFTDA